MKGRWAQTKDINGGQDREYSLIITVEWSVIDCCFVIVFSCTYIPVILICRVGEFVSVMVISFGGGVAFEGFPCIKNIKNHFSVMSDYKKHFDYLNHFDWLLVTVYKML